jgi:small subunit ribosomal protein S9
MTEETKPKAAKKKKSESETAGKATLAVAAKERALPTGNKYYGTGRRKEATAKVWLVVGSGKITINRRPMAQYFANRKLLEYYVNRPLVATQSLDKYDVYAFVKGGGVPGQAGAVSLGIARALVEINPDLKTLLKREGLMTRDPRMKERKKYGLKRARRAFQYSKR